MTNIVINRLHSALVFVFVISGGVGTVHAEDESPDFEMVSLIEPPTPTTGISEVGADINLANLVTYARAAMEAANG